MSDDGDEVDGDWAAEQLQPDDMLADEELTDILDRGYSPPDHPPHDYQKGSYDHESLDERLAEEEPDVSTGSDDDRADGTDFPSAEEVGGRRAGRLIGPESGQMTDDNEQLLAADVGIDGAGASAEEAAVHTIEDDWGTGLTT